MHYTYKMKKSIVITGGTGLIGSRLVELLDPDEYEIRIYTRNPREAHNNVRYYQWNPKEGKMDSEGLKNVDHIISLAGAGIADKKWTKDRKKVIIDSRVLGNNLIDTTLQSINHRPTSIVAGSAIGIYGNRADEELDEGSSIGDQEFLVESTSLWEQALKNLERNTDQFSLLRIGIVLSTKGGALQKMMIPLRFGISGYFGSGRQYYSWIHIDDICKMLIKGVEDKNWKGVYNGTSPHPLTLRQMAKQIKNMFLPIAIAAPVPEFLLRLFMGEMTNMLTNSTRVLPKKALSQDFEFSFTEVKKAVMDLKSKKI